MSTSTPPAPGTSKPENPFSKAAITALVTIVLSPISVAVVYYITHLLQAPKFKVEYVNSKLFITSRPIGAKVIRRIANDLLLVTALRSNLANLQESKVNCRVWLDDVNKWDDECLEVVLDAANGMLSSMNADITALQRNITAIETSPRNKPPALFPTSLHPMQEVTELAMVRDMANVLATFKNDLDQAKHERGDILVLLRELHRIETAESPLTGQIKVYVGVLNYGDVDGVVASRGKLKSDAQELLYDANAYAVIKSHSFQEIEFNENSTENNETALQQWHTRVLKRDGAKFQFAINADGKDLPLREAAVPK